MTKYLFYPGCAMVVADLGLSEFFLGIILIPAYAQIGRNLALAARQANGCHTVVASCSACYLNLAKADHYMAERATLGEHVNEALAAGDLSYKPGSLEIRHLLDVLINDVGLDTIKNKVVKPLKGLRVAPYLGCMVPRPDYKKRWSDHEYPNELDRLLKALGAEVIDFPLKTHCCGGHMTQISPPTAFELIRRLIHSADQYRADLMVTVCPMCQMNLDAYQRETNQHFHTNYQMPILFFTQLMGIAFGIEPTALGFGRELVNASPAMGRIGVETPALEQPPAQPKRKKAAGLPMPVMPGERAQEE